MLNVFITIDTEFWPSKEYRYDSDYVDDFNRDILGHTSAGEFGLEFQLQRFQKHDLKAVFLVEALAASALGDQYLKDTVGLIESCGQDTQLHVHPEWLSRISMPNLPARHGQHMHQFSVQEQAVLIGTALQNLRGCGAKDVTAFRAGNFGANWDTLRALAQNTIRYDTSYNLDYLNSICRMNGHQPLSQPTEIHDVWEFPVSIIRDGLGRVRPIQLTACSSLELEEALMGAWKHNLHSFVVVSHSFELIHRETLRIPAKVNSIVVKRFERLCEFLDTHRDKFCTRTFSDEINMDQSPNKPPKELRVSRTATFVRLVEQLQKRLLKNLGRRKHLSY